MDTEIKDYIDGQIEAAFLFSTKKVGDIPTDAFQLSNKAYVDRRLLWVILSDNTSPMDVGDSQASITVPEFLDGYKLTKVAAAVTTASASGGPILIQLAIGANDLLTTRISIDDTKKTSWASGTTPPVIDTTKNLLYAGDQIDVDIDDNGDGLALGWQLFLYVE